ncbi:ribonuclease 4-like [Antechinus flavipes]|uniref:ribonuclease 4-like n=1 Tax=Antechinus flavipes TaxID=38775 RepID=UPI002235B613|nr:ribonuclease 4-like [Antechinus flavipes]
MTQDRTFLLLLLLLPLLGLLGLWLAQSSIGEFGSETSRQQHVASAKKSVPHWEKQYCSIIIKNGNGTITNQCKSKNTFLHGKAGTMMCKIPIRVHCNKKRCQLTKQSFKQIHCLHQVPGKLIKHKYKSSSNRSKNTVVQDGKPEVPVHFRP